MIPIGTSASISHMCDDASTAIALGSGDVPVLGTPKVVALVEAAAVATVDGSLADGSTTVGTRIAIDHVAPTPVGRTVEARATVAAVAGRRIDFTVEVLDGDQTVAAGTHTRVVVDRDRFLTAQ